MSEARRPPVTIPQDLMLARLAQSEQMREFFETGLSPWDVAAGSLLVTEAGGLVGNFSGDSDFLEQKECMAANPRIYGQLVAILGKYSKFASAGEKAAVREAATSLSLPEAPQDNTGSATTDPT